MKIILLLKKLLKLLSKFMIYFPIILVIAALVACILLFYQNGNLNNLGIVQPRVVTLLLLALACLTWYFLRWTKNKPGKSELNYLAWYTSGLVLSFILLALVTTLNPKNPILLFIIISVLFILIGSFHLWMLLKGKIKAIILETMGLPAFLLTGFILFLGGIFFSYFSTMFAIKENVPAKIGIYDFTIIPFILPFIIYISLVTWKKIPKRVPLAWYYRPENIPPKVQIRPGDKVLNCSFNFANSDIHIKIPHYYKIGDAFYRIIKGAVQRGKSISLERVSDKGAVIPVEWYFLTQDVDSNKRRYLDPNTTFQASGIKDGDIIWVRETP